jgi:hypothetical protein
MSASFMPVFYASHEQGTTRDCYAYISAYSVHSCVRVSSVSIVLTMLAPWMLAAVCSLSSGHSRPRVLATSSWCRSLRVPWAGTMRSCTCLAATDPTAARGKAIPVCSACGWTAMTLSPLAGPTGVSAQACTCHYCQQGCHVRHSTCMLCAAMHSFLCKTAM